jgi:dipeptidyl-peptidase-4
MNKFLSAAALLLVAAPAVIAQKAITNETIWYSNTFSGDGLSGLVSMNDGTHYSAMESTAGGTEVATYDYATGEKSGTVVRDKDLVLVGDSVPLELDDYAFSGDERKLMLRTGIEPLYRHSFYATNYVYDRATKAVKPLTDPSKSKQRVATFSPDGSHAAFMRDNNLFTVDLATMQETAITTDGEWNKVLNGAPDWVYEEEFAFTQGYEWSPDGKKILYLRSDESAVKEYDLTMYQDQLYPSEYSFKYPKAGEINSTVSLHVYDIASRSTSTVPLGTAETDIYLPRFGFTGNSTVWFMRMNRLQNEKLIYTCDVSDVKKAGEPKAIYKETSPTYIEVTDDLHFLNDGSYILTNEQDGWNHIVWNSADGTKKRILTPGSYDVISVNGVDEKGKRVLFTASKLDPTQQEVWSMGLNGKGLKQLSPAGGTNDADFSTGFKYFINTRSTANDPGAITLYDGNGKLVKTLKDNTRLRTNLREYDLQPKEFITIAVGDGVVLNAWMIKPAGFDGMKKYPVFMTQYSGPNDNQVLDQWGGRNLLWHELLAQKGYIVVCADPRGTGHRGRDFRHMTYGQLGKYETEDQIGGEVVGRFALRGQHAHRHTRLELWRIHEFVVHHQGRWRIQGRDRRGPGNELALLRQHLHRALHGLAEGQRQRLRRQQPHQPRCIAARQLLAGTRPCGRQRAFPEQRRNDHRSGECEQAIRHDDVSGQEPRHLRWPYADAAVHENDQMVGGEFVVVGGAWIARVLQG